MIVAIESNAQREAVHRVGGAAGDEEFVGSTSEETRCLRADAIGGSQDRAVAVGHASRIGFEFVPGLEGAIEHGAWGGSERAGVEVGESGGKHVFGVSGLPCCVALCWLCGSSSEFA